MDVLILVGGLGTRLKSISKGIPKSLIEINNRPFLSILLNHISTFGFKRVILCTGYKSFYFEQYVNENNNYNIQLLISKEEEPLGTAGAIKNADSLIQSENFIVINGDSFSDLDYSQFCEFFIDKKPIAQIAVYASNVNKEYATIKLDSNCNIIQYTEKCIISDSGDLFISTGIYLFSKEILNFIRRDQFVSLEYDIIPVLIKTNPARVFGFQTVGEFIDIGTPKNYKKSQDILTVA